MSCSSCNKLVIENLNKLIYLKEYIKIFYNGENYDFISLNNLDYKIINTLKLKEVKGLSPQPIICVINKKGEVILIHQVLIGREDLTNRFFNRVNLLFNTYLNNSS